jgi:hypothetical protein
MTLLECSREWGLRNAPNAQPDFLEGSCSFAGLVSI